MDQFEIGRLTHFDFETLCKDILTPKLGVDLELFAPGADQGVDLRHFEAGGGAIVVQCKHWTTSPRAALVRHMKVSERPKIDRLAPTRYILATSADLTVKTKDDLLAALQPYVKSSTDILGLRDIVEELRNRPEVVQRHLRLWLNSTAVLQSLLNRRIVSRSRALRDDISSSLLTYVANDSFTRARDLLEDKHVCVIAGLPGIGKTTLAQALAAAYIADYELVDISEDVSEIDDAWSDDIPQLFYFDDFLGQTTLDDKLNKNEDRRLTTHMRRIHAAKNKRLILTTREYILAQAKERYERLANVDFDPFTALVDMGDYTPTIRAQILYNHVFFSQLDHESKSTFADPANHLPIVNHANFSPRLIEMSLSTALLGGVADPAQTILANLTNPEMLWRHIVEHQLNPPKLLLLEVLFSLAPTATLGRTQDAWLAYAKVRGYSFTAVDFKAALKALDGTMVRTHRTRNSGQVLVSFHNPSVRDYLRQYMTENPGILQSLLQSLEDLTQVFAIWSASDDAQGSALKTILRKHWDEVFAAIDRAAAIDRSAGGKLDINEMILLLGLGEEVRDTRVDEIAQFYLSRIDASEIDDGSEAVSLIRHAADSRHPKTRKWAADAIPGVLEWVLSDLWDWDNASFAQQLVDELGDLAPASARETVERGLDGAAERVIDRGASGQSFDASSLREALDYAGQYLDPDESFPGYAAAEQALAERDATLERPRMKIANADESRDSQSISAIFESLRSGQASRESEIE